MTAVEHYLVPGTLQEAARELADAPEETTIFAGGTDLMVQIRAGARSCGRRLMNVNRIESLRGIDCSNGEVRIGPLTTVTSLARSEHLKGATPGLVEAADCFACGQIRNAATIGGNICNASPAGDLIIPLLILGATLQLVSWRNGTTASRTVPIDGFFKGPGQTDRRPDELLASIHLPRPEPGTVVRFRKFGVRPAMDISIVSVGMAGTRDGNGLGQPRVAFGAVAPTPMRGRQTERALDEAAVLDAATVDRIARVAAEEVRPISDVRASAWYRRRLVHEMTLRILDDVRQAQHSL